MLPERVIGNPRVGDQEVELRIVTCAQFRPEAPDQREFALPVLSLLCADALKGTRHHGFRSFRCGREFGEGQLRAGKWMVECETALLPIRPDAAEFGMRKDETIRCRSHVVVHAHEMVPHVIQSQADLTQE
ncbi:MAG: hypothetical protein L0Z50_12810 [Verrucomicrobiales bacterium]|nr:hypothetical protein [Verrucomicrobiales bacterium]